MKNKQFRSRLCLMILLVLLVLGMVSFAVGKYVMSMSHPGTVTFSARLAEDVELWEHKAERTSNGDYTLTDETVKENAYVLIPGLDIRKDPYIVITGKTEIPANLYLEIVTNTIDAYQGVPIVSYAVNGNWKLSNRAARHNGTVYEYVGAGETLVSLTSANTPTGHIEILANNKVMVSQHAKHADVTENGDKDILKIYVYLVEATS